MKVIEHYENNTNAIFSFGKATIEASAEEIEQLKNAVAIMNKLHQLAMKSCDMELDNADFTMYYYEFLGSGRVVVRIEQGAAG